MTCKGCGKIKSLWFKFTGVERLAKASNVRIEQVRREAQLDYCKRINELESNLTDFRRSVRDHFKLVSEDIFQAREWADRMAEGKISPQRDRIVDLKMKLEKAANQLHGLDSEIENLGIRMDAIEVPVPKKIRG